MTETPPSPPALVGHARAQAHLAKLFAENRLPHALLLAGPKGIGKATFAFKLAAFLLSQKNSGSRIQDSGSLLFDGFPESRTLNPESLSLPLGHPILRRVAAGAHPDFLLLRPEFDDKKKEYKAEITVDESRRISDFMALTPAESAWRVALVDSADDLNRSAANAILKVLEEPPAKAVLILVSHNPGRLLPTIHSRCQMVVFPPLAPQEFRTALTQISPALSEEEGRALLLLSKGSPGRALMLHEAGGIASYAALVELASAYPHFAPARVQAFVDTYVKKDGEQSWQLLAWLADLFLTRIQKSAAQPDAIEDIIPGEKQVLRAMAAMQPLDFWFDVWERGGTMWNEASRLHLDKRLVLQQFLYGLTSPASQAT